MRDESLVSRNDPSCYVVVMLMTCGSLYETNEIFLIRWDHLFVFALHVWFFSTVLTVGYKQIEKTLASRNRLALAYIYTYTPCFPLYDGQKIISKTALYFHNTSTRHCLQPFITTSPAYILSMRKSCNLLRSFTTKNYTIAILTCAISRVPFSFGMTMAELDTPSSNDD